MHCPILPIIYLRQYNHLLIYDFLSYIVILFMVIIAKLIVIYNHLEYNIYRLR